MSLAGKSVVITGAGSGVGRASSLRFAEEGAKVVCADVDGDSVKETVRLVTQAGGTAIAVHCDVASEKDVIAAIEAAVSNFGRLDVMFNNAGITGFTKAGARFEDETIDDWQRLNDVNFRGVFFGCKHAVIRFKAQGNGGVIINTGSVAGMVGWGSVVYGATKGGVNQMTRGVAIECAPFDIRVNAICPAAMPNTKFASKLEAATGASHEEFVKASGAVHPLGRPITAEDCAEAAVFLASDKAKNITGVLLPIDGGFVAR